MKKIQSFEDIKYIMDNLCNVFDPIGNKIPFATFMGYDLWRLRELLYDKTWEYIP